MSLRIIDEPFDSAVATDLIEQVQGEYVRRYGTGDEGPITADEFVPPSGVFLVAWDDEQRALGCGGIRQVSAGVAEIKRMYVRPTARRRGVARAVLCELEHRARTMGVRRLQLETGSAQPEAIAMYESAGYSAIEPFGWYRNSPKTRCFGKDLV